MSERSGAAEPRRRASSAREIAAAQLGEQLALIVARIETTTDDLAAVASSDHDALSPEGRHILQQSGHDGLTKRLKSLEAERAQVSEHADQLRLRPAPQNPLTAR